MGQEDDMDIPNGPLATPRAEHTAGSASEVFPLVYAQLHAAARRLMSNERAGHTLQPTALINEAYASLAKDLAAQWPGPREFYLAAAEAMRHILIDHARRRGAEKRGGGRRRVLEFEGVMDLAREESLEDVTALDEAILRLERDDARAAEVVRLRFFAGLTGDRVAEVLGISSRQADRDWAYARAFLMKELGAVGPAAGDNSKG